MRFRRRKNRRGGIVRRWVECPECGERFYITWRLGVKRFKAKLHGCPNCDFVGRRGQFDRPQGL